MKIVSVVGARPQFIKASPVSKVLRQTEHQEFMIHTGQHYDYEMSRVFFDEMELPAPDVNLGVRSGHHGKQTGEMLMQIEKVLMAEKPSCVLVYGDTNSTLAGALAAVKLHIPVAHVEAGLRSFNRIMPEEHNRVLTDHCSDLFFCPTKVSVENLKNEGIFIGVHLVGDVMYDSVLYNVKLAENKSKIIKKLPLKPRGYALATIHRAENTDDSNRLRSIFEAFEQISSDELPVIIPLHPRTQKIINKYGLYDLSLKYVQIIKPVSYLDMLLLEKYAKMILTDSGGVQKEAFWMKVPCITLRDETEWEETVEVGWNVVVGADKEKIVKATKFFKMGNPLPELYGNGRAAEKIVEILAKKFKSA
ncbi:MAG: UDP-N-acetylglucosamine 2-epimerase (non-hydrolyzing) [Deltaproteobacteria bacterium]|nr:MAG: UDP-N-acetylglucosamine 2-epimerase (non-hydrolyzing) [Deltaproteobacteria bacterium]